MFRFKVKTQTKVPSKQTTRQPKLTQGNLDSFSLGNLQIRQGELERTVIAARNRAADVVEELDAAMIEMGNGHSTTCDKQTGHGLPCSCGFSNVVKAQKIAVSLHATL